MIVIGFGLLASPAHKTRSATAQEGTADLLVQSAWIDRVLAFVGLMQQGRATFPSMPGMLILSSRLTVAQPATTQQFYCPAATFGVMRPM